MLLHDENGVAFLAAAGRPAGEDWAQVCADSHQSILDEGRKLQGVADVHRRGAFPAFSAGVSHGGGRKVRRSWPTSEGVLLTRPLEAG